MSDGEKEKNFGQVVLIAAIIVAGALIFAESVVIAPSGMGKNYPPKRRKKRAGNTARLFIKDWRIFLKYWNQILRPLIT